MMGLSPASWHQLGSVLLWAESHLDIMASRALTSLVSPEMKVAIELANKSSSKLLTRSRFHESVLRTLSDMGVASQSEVSVSHTMRVDVWVDATGSGHTACAIEVEGPAHFHPEVDNNLQLTRASIQRRRVLSKLAAASTGQHKPFVVAYVDFMAWRNLDTKKERQYFLRKILQQ
jgi:hypothetical protein